MTTKLNEGPAPDVSRRRFLALGGLVTATVMAPQLVAAAEGVRASTIGFGFSLYGMKSLATGDALQACADIGYDCVELPVHAGWPTDSSKLTGDERQRIRDKLAATGLRLSALMENLQAAVDGEQHQSNLARLRAVGRLAHDLFPGGPHVIETVLGGRPAHWETARETMTQRLRDWAKVAAETKTVIAIKAHVGGAMHWPEQAVWLAEQVDSPWIKCVYDYSHFELRGIDMAESIKTLAPHSVFVHVKDSRGDADNVQFLLPGDGRTDYSQYLKLLTAAGYRGDVVVEVSGQIHGRAGYDPLAAAKNCYAKLAPAFEKAGVQRG
jgi:sugar phosphate isomerase/epimerase